MCQIVFLDVFHHSRRRIRPQWILYQKRKPPSWIQGFSLSWSSSVIWKPWRSVCWRWSLTPRKLLLVSLTQIHYYRLIWLNEKMKLVTEWPVFSYTVSDLTFFYLSTFRQADPRADPSRLLSTEEDRGLLEEEEREQSWPFRSMQSILHPHPTWLWVKGWNFRQNQSVDSYHRFLSCCN